MDDLIERQSVLDEISNIRRRIQLLDDTQRADLVMHGLYLCEKAIEKLPSAKDINVPSNDCISRQAAIEVASRECHELRGVFSDIEHGLKELPSAEPERKTGKWIPHREKSREYIGTVLVCVTYDYWLCDTCGYRVENGQPIYNFCPNCGARMVDKE